MKIYTTKSGDYCVYNRRSGFYTWLIGRAGYTPEELEQSIKSRNWAWEVKAPLIYAIFGEEY